MAETIPTVSWRGGGWLRAVATYDFFPHYSARVRRLLYNPLGVLILAALMAFFCGVCLHPQGYLLMAGVLTVIVLGVAAPWINMRGMRGSLAFSRTRSTEGEGIDVCLTLVNRLPWSVWGLVVRGGLGQSPAGEANDAVAVSIASAPRWRIAHCRWRFVPACRGVYPLDVPRLATGFPFGLWENRRRVTVETSLLVWPRTFPVGPAPIVGGDCLTEGNVSRNKSGSNGDVLGVRPFRRGDSPRRIHWGQSARHDRLIVCELQSNTRPVIQLVLDADPTAHAGAGPDGSREWAVRVAASLAKGWLESGAQVAGVWAGQEFAAASGPRQIQRLFDSLTELPDDAGPLADVLNRRACRGFIDGLQVVVTTDAALARNRHAISPGDRQRWVVLHAAAFDGSRCDGRLPPPWLPVRPWLWIDRAEHVPALLRGGWKEARHGS
jgi:uncharacterized protein (DUF58 family)